MKGIENSVFPDVSSSGDDRGEDRSDSYSPRPIEARIIDRLAPPHVVINAAGEIFHYSTRTEKYLERPRGAPNCHLLSMARKELQVDLQSALDEAAQTRRAAFRDNITLEAEGECVSIKVEP